MSDDSEQNRESEKSCRLTNPWRDFVTVAEVNILKLHRHAERFSI